MTDERMALIELVEKQAGIRSDLAGKAADAEIAVSGMARTVSDVIGTMPALRSGISRDLDDAAAWQSEVADAARQLGGIYRGKDVGLLREAFSSVAKRMTDGSPTLRTVACLPEGYGTSNDELLRWLERPELRALAQHETRGHMASDLGRDLFAAVFGAVRGYSPKAADFPLRSPRITGTGTVASSMTAFGSSWPTRHQSRSRATSPTTATTRDESILASAMQNTDYRFRHLRKRHDGRNIYL